MRWFHILPDGAIEGFTDSASAKELPEPPKGIKFVEATPERMEAYNALLTEKHLIEDVKPAEQRGDTRVKIDADTAVFETIASGRPR